MHLPYGRPFHGVVLLHGDASLAIASQVFAPRNPLAKKLLAGTGITLTELAGFTQIAAVVPSPDDSSLLIAGRVYRPLPPVVPAPPDDAALMVAHRAMLPHPQRPDDLIAGTNVTIVQSAGSKTISAASTSTPGDDAQIILPGQDFARRPIRPDDLVAGSNITITQSAGTKSLTITTDSDQFVLPGAIFDPRAQRPPDIRAGGGITVTQSAGTVTIASTASPDSDQTVIAGRAYRPLPTYVPPPTADSQNILPTRIFDQPVMRPDDIRAGAGISITQAAGTKTVTATGIVTVDSADNVLSNRIYRPLPPVVNPPPSDSQAVLSAQAFAPRPYTVPISWVGADSTKFLRGDRVWSNTLTGDFTVNGNTILGDADTDTFATRGIASMRRDAAGADGNVLRLINNSGTANSAAVLSLDPGNNGFGVRDALIKASNSGGNAITLTFAVANGAAPATAITVAPTTDVTLARDFTVTRNAVINGNTTLGDASGDSVTFNAATWTIANNITATRAIGVVGGTTFGATWNTTGQVDASGTATIIGQNFSFTHSGANNGDSIRAFRTTTDHQGSGTLGEIHGMNVTGTVSGTGNVTHYYGSLSQLQLTNSANVSNALYFYAVAPVLSSTGAVTEMDGFFSGNLGHASLVTSAWGFNASDITASLSNVAGFRSQVNSGTNKWGLYFDGTADNALNGKLRIGSTTAPTVALDVTGSAAISSDLTLPAAPSDPILLASIFGR